MKDYERSFVWWLLRETRNGKLKWEEDFNECDFSRYYYVYSSEDDIVIFKPGIIFGSICLNYDKISNSIAQRIKLLKEIRKAIKNIEYLGKRKAIYNFTKEGCV